MPDEDETEEVKEELEEDDGQEYIFGIAVPSMDANIQPLELIVLIQGINMDDGNPTMTTIGSEGITPWMAAGLMTIELERLKAMSVIHTMGGYVNEDEEDEE
jgi:hypothetical protein